MVLELLYRGYKGMFLNNFIIYHPNKKDSINKIYSYGLGYGATLKKHVKLRRGNNLIFDYLIIDSVIKPIFGMVINIAKFNNEGFILYKERMRSRIKGYLEYEI